MVYIYHTDILKCRHKIKQHTITVDSQVKKPTGNWQHVSYDFISSLKNEVLESTLIPVVFNIN